MSNDRSKSKITNPTHVLVRGNASWGTHALIARLALLLASAIAVHLLWRALNQEPVSGCGPGSSCDRVLGSHWAYVMDVPVSALALTTYLITLLLTFKVTPQLGRPFALTPAYLLVAASSMLIGAAIWFLGLQAFLLNAFCKYCVTAHLLGAMAGGLMLFQVASMLKSSGSKGGGRLPSRVLSTVGAGLAAVALMATFQFQWPHRQNMVRVHRGTFKLDLRELPRIGSDQATRVFVSLFDYTCPDCKDMHKLLDAALKRYGNELAFVALPMPLDGECNPMVKRTQPKHEKACELAKLGLALRIVSNHAFQQFDAWYFGSPTTPTFEESEAKAKSLVDAETLQKALSDPRIESTLRTSLSLYELNGNITTAFRMPQLVIGDRVSVGRLETPEALFELLERHLGVTPPKSLIPK